MRAFAIWIAFTPLVAPSLSMAQEAAPQAPVAPGASGSATDEARAAFTRGNELAKAESWAEALAAFQRSYELVPHPSTAFNVAMSERVLGRYTRARDGFVRALADSRLPASLADEARNYLAEIERILARVMVELTPTEAGIAVDGRPLQLEARPNGEAGAPPLLVSGVRASGPGEPAPGGAARFELLVDPGARVFLLSRKGYKDVVRQERFLPGGRGHLRLELERMPALLRIESNVAGPVVAVNEVDVGVAPVDVSRPAGTYRVVVRKPGFVAHDMRVTVGPGDEAKVDAKLAEEHVPITKRWWFWAGAAAVLAGGATLTYALTRPEPAPRPYEAGSTGWLVGP